MTELPTTTYLRALATDLPIREADRVRKIADSMEWQPIETAPKDRCIILSDGYDTYSGFWHDGSQCYGHRGKAGWFYEEDMGSLLTASNAHPIAWQEWPEPAPIQQPPPATGEEG